MWMTIWQNQEMAAKDLPPRSSQSANFLSWRQAMCILALGTLILTLYRIFSPLIEVWPGLAWPRLKDDPVLFSCSALVALSFAALIIPTAVRSVRRWTNHKRAALPDILLIGVAGGLLWPALCNTSSSLPTHQFLVIGTLTILCYQEARLRTISNPKRRIRTLVRFGPTGTEDGPLPTITPNSDLLGRLPFCEMLTQKLGNVPLKESHIIGISGSWGSGKTTVLNHCAGELVKMGDGPMVIAFDAWLFRDTGRLIEGLLGLIGSEIESNYLYHDAQTLAKQLARILSAGSTRFRELPKLFETSENPLKLRQRFADLIAKTDERIVVFIDDVERLTRDELHALLKTVREGALVPGITYLLSYDRVHLVELLGASNGVGTGYLEKIIEEELELPGPELSRWRSFAQLELNAIVSGVEDKLAADFRERLAVAEKDLAVVLQTPRHVKRVRIAVLNIAARMRRVLNPFDLLVLEVLRQRYRSVYDLIRNNPEFFCDSHEFRLLTPLGETMAAADRKPLNDAVESCLKNAGLERPVVEKLLAAILPRFGKGVRTSQETCFRLRRLCDLAHFDWYFKLERPDHIPEQGLVEDMVAGLNAASNKTQRQELLTGYLLKTGRDMLWNRFARIRAFAQDLHPNAILPTVEALLDSVTLFSTMNSDSNPHRYNACALLIEDLLANLPSKAQIAEGMAGAIARSPNLCFSSELLILAYNDAPSRTTPSPLALRCQQAFDSRVEQEFIVPQRDIFSADIETRGCVIELYSKNTSMRSYLNDLLTRNPANGIKLLRHFFTIIDTHIGEPFINIRDDALVKLPNLEELTASIRTLQTPSDVTEARMIVEFLTWVETKMSHALGATPDNADVAKSQIISE